jgi:propionate CoA-transferase
MAEHRQTKDVFYDSSMSGHLIVPVDQIAPLPLDMRKVIARRCVMELVPSAVINLGIGVRRASRRSRRRRASATS